MKHPKYIDVADAARAFRIHPATVVRRSGLAYRKSITKVPLADLCRGIEASPETVMAFINGHDQALTSDEIAKFKPVAKFGRGHRYSKNSIIKREADGMLPSNRAH